VYQQAYLLNEDIFSVEKDLSFLIERGEEVLFESIVPEPVVNALRETGIMKDSDRAMMDFAYKEFSGTIGLSEE
ncbi:hypothetical protein GTO27_04235, partial [Candidatus Bathyarchaeota archaeon]|nr:hypothetical protein [Candidatus Bathyarchaeota archaeon]